MIAPNTTMGRVSLTVANLERSLAYYQHNIGLQVHRCQEETAVLGSGLNELLILKEMSNGRSVRGVTGLYHFALLLPSRYELARTLQHLINSRTVIAGASDHAVSEALYLTDPDGHGIEIYRDRPRSEWQYLNGNLKMVTKALDLDGILGQLTGKEAAWTGLHPDTVMGHVHIHVSHLAENEQFYTNILGFEVMAHYGNTAGFIAAGGYHHHIGMNTWAGIGASPPPADAVQLQWFEIRLPQTADLQATLALLEAHHIPVIPQENGYLLRDLSQNGILLTTI